MFLVQLIFLIILDKPNDQECESAADTPIALLNQD